MRINLKDSYIIGVLYSVLIGLIAVLILYIPITLAIGRLTISAVIPISQFLAGFGLLGLIFTGTLYVLRYMPKKYRKKRTSLVLIRIVLCPALAASIILPLWNLIRAFRGEIAISPISMLYGLASFVITMYLVPLWRERKLPEDEREGIFASMKEALGKLSRKIKKGYYHYFSKDYIKMFSVDFIYLKTRIDSKRASLGRLFFPLIIIATAYCPPALVIGLVYIIRLRKDSISVIDNVALSIALLTSLMAPLFLFPIPEHTIVWNLAYFLGSVLAAVSFGPAVTDLIRS